MPHLIVVTVRVTIQKLNLTNTSKFWNKTPNCDRLLMTFDFWTTLPWIYFGHFVQNHWKSFLFGFRMVRFGKVGTIPKQNHWKYKLQKVRYSKVRMYMCMYMYISLHRSYSINYLLNSHKFVLVEIVAFVKVTEQ